MIVLSNKSNLKGDKVMMKYYIEMVDEDGMTWVADDFDTKEEAELEAKSKEESSGWKCTKIGTYLV